MTATALLEQRVSGRRSRKLPVRLDLSRNHLPGLFRRAGFQKGAEIGVWKGAYSAQFCDAGIHMLCVDPWESYPAWLDTKNSLPVDEARALIRSAYETALARLVGLPCTIVREFSELAAKMVPDGSLDFVYIDGNHTFDAVTADLQAWAPKVRRGGVVAGHDYRVFTNKPTIHVVEAVRAYTTAHGIARWYITATDRTPSFLWTVS